jgi:hypothetical protein
MAHIEDHGKNMRQVVSSKGLFQAGLRKRYDEQTPILDKYLYDLPEIMKFRADLIDRLMLIVFSDTSDQKN